jgi:hypothetical protein
MAVPHEQQRAHGASRRHQKILAHTDTHPHQHGIILAFTHAACQRSDDGAMATWLSSQQLV